ncbi:DUF320 domain-containing protein [Dactylosporangium vinaceum]|uniref:Chaplin family protein n=1 Tax=Dactylosporangium vinaceum TaxID=53362 RepID=A0ABV5MJF2_9ACTN|nr:chaplin family protein [Dactylosporangium vinaceum]UAB93604.1 DUF320 domain-containing protein [Dactylosporangium vinaceum]
MKRWLIRSVQVAALAMGGLALTGTAAHADNWSGPNAGFFNGNQSSTTIQTPVNICGNSLAIIGFASANCDGGAVAYNGDGGAYSSAGYNGGNGYRNGNGGGANVNSVSNHHKKKKHHRHNNNGNANAMSYDDRNDYRGRSNGGGGNGGALAYNDNGNWSTGYNAGFGNGNQSSFTYQAPTNVSCNSVALIGFASSC